MNRPKFSFNELSFPFIYSSGCVSRFPMLKWLFCGPYVTVGVHDRESDTPRYGSPAVGLCADVAESSPDTASSGLQGS